MPGKVARQNTTAQQSSPCCPAGSTNTTLSLVCPHSASCLNLASYADLGSLRVWPCVVSLGSSSSTTPIYPTLYRLSRLEYCCGLAVHRLTSLLATMAKHKLLSLSMPRHISVSAHSALRNNVETFNGITRRLSPTSQALPSLIPVDRPSGFPSPTSPARSTLMNSR